MFQGSKDSLGSNWQNYPKDGDLLSEITNDSVDLNMLDDYIQEPIDLDEFYEIFDEIAGAETETIGNSTENETFQQNNEVTSTEILNGHANGSNNHDSPISNEITFYNNDSLRKNNSYLSEFESFLNACTKDMNTKHTTDIKSDKIHKSKNKLDSTLTKNLESRKIDINSAGIEIEITVNANTDNDDPLLNNDDQSLITLAEVDFSSTNNFQDSLNATSKQSNDNFKIISGSTAITLSSDSECSNLNFNGNDEEDIETISLISDIDEIEASVDDISVISMTNDDDNDYPEGYHSSDFEFIAEDEAKQSNLNISTEILDKPKKTENTRIETKEIANTDSNKNGKEFVDVNKASTSGAPKTMKLNNKDKIEKYKYYRSIRREFELEQSKNARLAHVVPQGDDYLDLFRGINAVADNAMEHKSVGLRPTKCMNVLIKEFEFGPGFDYEAPRIITDEERKYQQEAADNARKILDLYPGENRKRKRRF